MQFDKISAADRSGKGNVGQPDTPNLNTLQMQTLMDSLPNLAIDKFNDFIDALNAAIVDIVADIGSTQNIPTTKAVYDFVKEKCIDEIVNARTGVDGTVYDSLGEAIRTQLATKITNPGDAQNGDYLRVDGSGNIVWEDGPTTEEIETATALYFADHPDAIPEAMNGITSRVNALEDQNGSEALTTTAQTLSGAVNELVDADVRLHREIVSAPRTLTANIIFDAMLAKNPYMQGACYVGDNRVVIYFNTSNSDTGKLRCFDLVNYSMLWEYDVKAYHGNAICYVPDSGYIYLAGYSQYDGTTINKVVKTNISDPSSYTEIDAPINTFTVAYDMTEKKFYATEGFSATSQGRVLYKFSDEFQTIEREIVLENKQLDFGLGQGQGFHCIADGKIYNLSIRQSGKLLFTNDIATGKNISITQIPFVLNYYRDSGEPEALIYDYDNDRYIMSFALPKCGVPSKNAYSLAEIGLYKDVYEFMPCNRDNNTSMNYDRYIITYLENGCETFKPIPFAPSNDILTFKCISDILTFNRWFRSATRIFVNTTLTGSTNVIDILYLRGNNIQLSFQGAVVIKKVISQGNNIVTFMNAEFNSVTVDGNYEFHLVPFLNDKFTLINCTFDDFTPTKTSPAHILIWNNSEVIEGNAENVYGSSVAKYRIIGSHHAVFVPFSFYKRRSVTKNEVSTVANTYVDTGLTFTIEEDALVIITTNREGYDTIGTFISNTANSMTGNVCALRYETPDHHRNTPAVLLIPGTYYVWIKKTGAINTLSVSAQIRELPQTV